LRETDPNRLAIAAFSLAVDVRAGAVISLLDRGGIPSILIKGATLKRWLYPDEPRRYGDVDILVPPDRLGDVGDLLRGVGYEASPYDGQTSHAECHHRYGDPIEKVDVHRSFHYVTSPPEVFWECIDRDAVPFPLHRCEARAPSLPARALLAALHAVIHGPAPQQREDLRRAVAHREVWPRAVELAVELDAVTGLVAGLRCIPEGARLADALGLADGLPLEIRLAAEGAPFTAQGIRSLIEAPTVRARAGLLARELFPPRLQMHKHVPLARRGRLGMLAAYSLRPLMLARAAPAGWRSVRSLRATGTTSASPGGDLDSPETARVREQAQYVGADALDRLYALPPDHDSADDLADLRADEPQDPWDR
jgi:hypothetical protein